MYPVFVVDKGKAKAWIKRWWATTLAAVGVVLAVGGPFWGNFTTNQSERMIAFAVGVVGALIALLLPIREKRRSDVRITELEHEAKQAKVLGRADFQYSLNYLLTPLLWELGRVARTRPGTQERATAAAKLKVKALDFLMRVTNPQETGLRATFFRCEGQGDDLTLLADESTGEQTRRSFDASTVEGRRALHIVRTGKTDFSENIADEPPDRIDHDQQHNYQTFAAAAAYDGVETIGMVTVDGQKPGDIAKVDQYVVRTVGTIIAISEALRGNKR